MMLPTENEYRITAETLLASTSGYHSHHSYGATQNADICKILLLLLI